MTKILLHGANGYMGHVVQKMCDADDAVTIVAGIDAYPGEGMPFPVYDRADRCTEEADVLIDFSTAAAVDALLEYGVGRALPMVICTTGLSDAQIEELHRASEHVAILRSANMSLGIHTVAKLVADATNVLYGAGFDIEVEEMHHRRKIDAPSGTALYLAERAKEAAGGQMDIVYDRTERHEARPANEIGVSALRGGTVVGEHRVIFAGEDEVITITHSAASRQIFASGAIAAAKFLAGKGPGLYSMEDVIG